MYEKGVFRPAPPWGWGKALRPPRYVWSASGVDDDVDYADPAPHLNRHRHRSPNPNQLSTTTAPKRSRP
jgi:hypothetical protein